MRKEEASSQDTDNATPNQIEDLTLNETESTTVKGGAAYMKLGDIKGDCDLTRN
jgi:hypothetical protein